MKSFLKCSIPGRGEIGGLLKEDSAAPETNMQFMEIASLHTGSIVGKVRRIREFCQCPRSLCAHGRLLQFLAIRAITQSVGLARHSMASNSTDDTMPSLGLPAQWLLSIRVGVIAVRGFRINLWRPDSWARRSCLESWQVKL